MIDDGLTSSSAPSHRPEQHARPVQPLFSSLFWTELLLVFGVVGLVIWAAEDLLAWARSLPPVQTPAPATAANGCAPPTEHEVLFIGVARQPDGTLMITGCTHAAGKGAYVRRGAP